MPFCLYDRDQPTSIGVYRESPVIGTEDYPSEEVEEMARQIASEHARPIWLVQDKTLAGTGSEPTNDIRRPRAMSLSSVPRRIASEVAATLRLIQNLEK